MKLQKDSKSVLEALRGGIEAYDIRTCEAVEIEGADPAYCII